MAKAPIPTERELEILKVLWDRGEATVRQVYEELRDDAQIVQNTVQAFLRTMEDKGLVKHRVEGRTFIYQPCIRREPTNRRIASKLLGQVFDGAVDQLVQSVFSLKQPTEDELRKLEELISETRAGRKPQADRRSDRHESEDEA